MKQEYLSQWPTVVAVAALLWSVIGFWLNRRHADKVFRSSTFPLLRLFLLDEYRYEPKDRQKPEDESCTYELGTYLIYRILNQSDEASASWVEIVVKLYRLRKILWFWQRSGGVEYETRTWPLGLRPGDDQHECPSPDLEKFVYAHFPGVLKLEEHPRPHYVVEDTRPLELEFRVHYRPVRVGTKPVTKRQVYRLTPEEREIPREAVGGEVQTITHGREKYWAVEEVLSMDKAQ